MPLCCCCLSLQVVSYHACVCGLFHSYVFIHCVSVLSMPSECRVCVVVCGFNLIFFPFYCVYSCCSLPPRTSTLANKSTHCNGERFGLEKKLYLQFYIYICTCTRAQVTYSSGDALNPYMLECISGSNMCILACTYTVFYVKPIGQP